MDRVVGGLRLGRKRSGGCPVPKYHRWFVRGCQEELAAVQGLCKSDIEGSFGN